MKKQIFREKTLEHFSSPEQLNDYIKVSNPGIWLTLTVIVVLLLGVCVWGVFGRLDTKIPVVVIVQDDTMVCYIRENEIDIVKLGIPVELNGKVYQVNKICDFPVELGDDFDSYFYHISGLQNGEWVYKVDLESGNLSDGIYCAEMVIDSVSPASFVTN